MDAHHYSSNVIGTSAPAYPSPTAVSPHQLQQGLNLPPHTLPPLQPHNAAMQSGIYGSHPHTPRTPSTPSTPAPNAMSNYQPPNQASGRGNYPMMSNPYPQPHQGYPTSASMMPQSSVSTSHPQPIAPAPASARPPVLRPMPAGGVMPQSGLSSPYSQSPLMPHQQSILQDNEQPTHVVGSQGRRGILPSAPGRPAAPTGSGASKTVIPQKDADGKFPCPHCTKTYLHAKHLKRHLLRHTGDRPYMCVLCRDTFSRSDILKRHFQKCSIRRGNPTGVSHLSHPNAHVKKQNNAQKANEADMGHMNGMSNMPNEGVVHPFGMVPLSEGMQNMPNDQNQLSRSSSIGRIDDANRDRRTMPGGYNGDVSNGMPSNINPQLANYSMPGQQNGMQMFAGNNSDWSQMFPSQDGVSSITPNEFHDRSLFFSNWAMPSSMHDPYQQLSGQILNFFYPPGTVVTSQTSNMKQYFSPANISNFLEKYTHFHVHFSLLHIPTFRIMEAYTGLIAAMCCIGACYSELVLPAHVREMTNFLKIALERESNLFSGSNLSDIQNTPESPYANIARDTEKLQALMLLAALLVWNGTPVQRDSFRRLFPLVTDMIKMSGLTRVSAAAPLFSILHQPNLSLENLRSGDFDWNAWVEQEKRIRLMYFVLMCDAAYGLYFNMPDEFDVFDIQIPLPADDAAWEARSPGECAEALNLYGSDAAKTRNPDGSQRTKQPELDLALRALLHRSYRISPGSTNLVGKFIIIHALLTLIRRVQSGGSLTGTPNLGEPLPRNDWIDAGSGNVSAEHSGRATPISGLPHEPSMQALRTALDKFKANWDMDMLIQFPPSVPNPRRYGFSRDGIHFYWLATYLLKHSQPADFQMPPDHRFVQVIQLLKSVKAWVMSDGAQRGEELGSVGEIDNEFGISNLTLDMAQLFKPLDGTVEPSALPSVKTNI